MKNGTTSAGRTRWRCRTCGASTTQHRPDITRHAQLAAFHTWILSPNPQRDHGGTGRTFRAHTSWCWNIPVPQPINTGEIHDVLMIEGTYLQGWCLLIAYTGTHVAGWQWCDTEKKIAYEHLIHDLTRPRMVIIDGGSGLAAALQSTWPQVPVQRCYFHIHHTIRRHLTFAPRLDAGRELLTLTTALMRVRTLDDAAAWMSAYATWETRWDAFLKHRTYAGNHKPRPTGISATQTWWYTRRDLRRARGLYRTLIRTNTLFTWLTLDEPHQLPRTTSPLEGGPNKAVKDLLRAHRGLPEHHARRAVEWLLNSLSEFPHDPHTLMEPVHWQPARRPRALGAEPIGPQPGTSFSWEDGNGLQRGWAGRSGR